jgi:hypothetical protein
MNYSTRLRPVRLLVMAVIVASIGGGLLVSEDAGPSQWVVRFQAGAASMKMGRRLKLTIDKEKVLLEPERGLPFAIPVAGITAVSSSIKGRHPATDAEGKFLSSFLSSPGDCYSVGCPGIILFTPILMAFSYPIKSTDHLVSILWQQKGVDEEVVLRIAKSDYTPFISELEKATGKKWKNLDAEWEKVQQELKREAANKISVRLDRKVRIAKSDLQPGAYQVVLLEREGNHAELYFFPGNQVNVEHLAAVALVETATPTNDTEAGPVNYKEDKNGITTISEIHTAGKTLRFP